MSALSRPSSVLRSAIVASCTARWSRSCRPKRSSIISITSSRDCRAASLASSDRISAEVVSCTARTSRTWRAKRSSISSTISSRDCRAAIRTSRICRISSEGLTVRSFSSKAAILSCCGRVSSATWRRISSENRGSAKMSVRLMFEDGLEPTNWAFKASISRLFVCVNPLRTDSSPRITCNAECKSRSSLLLSATSDWTCALRSASSRSASPRLEFNLSSLMSTSRRRSATSSSTATCETITLPAVPGLIQCTHPTGSRYRVRSQLFNDLIFNHT
mmetsp:Transcript_44683/g.106022  ORF Transcript_44683/g.106022 Transcript_44683/m.106022 type:complete len:275 (-) Transcript_44683:7-831(-)